MNEEYPWELPLGARPLGGGRVEFRVWAPHAGSVVLRLGDSDVSLEHAGLGVYEVVAPARAGSDYWFVLDGRPLPDPCSRWQPEGLRGPSRVLDPSPPESFERPRLEELVIYELHVGTFTDQGTFDAAAEHFGELAELGVSAIELMPVAEFPGRHGWGYDGVYLSAAHSAYGGPEGLERLVQAAHRAGLAVILDVVYNHVGASGVQALEAFGPYFTGKYETPWGRAINFDDAGCEAVREWVLQSATGWRRDFGIDGLRLDAIHAIVDSSAEHIVAAIARRVHETSARALVIAESALQDPDAHGAVACDAVWRDDFHHALHVLLTGEREGYYTPFGRVEQLADAFARVPPERFVVCSQNHDQVGNRAFGDRMPAQARPLAAFCTLLAPFTPLLFMGEEYGEQAPFQFFCDHIDEPIAQATRVGRRREFAAFAPPADSGAAQPDDSSAAHPGEAGGRARGRLEGEAGGGEPEGEEVPDPQDPETFARSTLTRRRDPKLAQLYAELLAARRRLPAGAVDAIEFDEPARWLRLRRGRFELVCNFTPEVRRVPCEGTAVALATAGEPRLAGGEIELESLSGALIE